MKPNRFNEIVAIIGVTPAWRENVTFAQKGMMNV